MKFSKKVKIFIFIIFTFLYITSELKFDGKISHACIMNIAVWNFLFGGVDE